MSDNFDPDALDREYARRQAERQATNNNPDSRTQTSEGGKRKSDNSDGRTATKTRHSNESVRFFTDGRFTFLLGIVFFIIAAYLTFAALSYFTSGHSDQSHVLNLTIDEMSQRPEEIDNLGGAFGAFLSESLISNGLGLGALVLVYYFFALGLQLIIPGRRRSFWFLTMRCLCVAITVSMVAGLATYGADTWLYWGGIHGYEVNRFLIANAGLVGAISVNLVLIGLVIAIYLNELRKVYMAYRRRMDAFRERQAAEREEKAARRRHVEQSLRNSDEQLNDNEPTADATAADTSQPQNPTATTPHEEKPIIMVDSGLDVFAEPPAEPKATAVPPTATETPSDTSHHTTDNTSSIEPATETVAEPEPTLTVSINEVEEATSVQTEAYDPTADLPGFRFPSIDLLLNNDRETVSVDEHEMEENKQRITTTLANYGVNIQLIKATVGPTITLYEIVPTEGTRISRIKGLEDDIALNLAALGIRIIAPIPGKGTIGIEVPNREPQIVPMRSIITSRKYQECRYELPMAMGLTISKEVLITDLAKMPHLLVAGATGMGKSVGLNAIITSLLYKKHPAELKFVLIDPKKVEFTLYKKLERHYLAKLPEEDSPIITDTSKVVATLNSLCVEMDNRYDLLQAANVRNIKEYNAKFVQRRLNPEKGHRFLPYIVIIIDEFADLIVTAGKEVETPIQRITQLARAVGIHMILATQRPSTNVITGTIKVNIPGRIAFRVTQMVDSRTILDRPGANQLIGKGDMLFSQNGEMDRVQCAFISTEEVEAINESIEEQLGYESAYYLPDYVPGSDSGGSGGSMGSVNDLDPLFKEAAQFFVSSGTASTSLLQRRYSIGYNRAGKIIDQLEARGIVGPVNGAKPRNVLVDSLQLERIFEIIEQ